MFFLCVRRRCCVNACCCTLRQADITEPKDEKISQQRCQRNEIFKVWSRLCYETVIKAPVVLIVSKSRHQSVGFVCTGRRCKCLAVRQLLRLWISISATAGSWWAPPLLLTIVIFFNRSGSALHVCLSVSLSVSSLDGGSIIKHNLFRFVKS